MLITRNDSWRAEYRRRRYLADLSRADLNKRFEDVVNNMVVLTEGGQLGLRPMKKPYRDDRGMYWMILWTHILEEFCLRYGPYPNGIDDGSLRKIDIVKPSFPDIPKAVTAIAGIDHKNKEYFYKFGREEFLHQSLKRGIFRISPASCYADPSLNKAMQDDELNITLIMPSMDVKITSSKLKNETIKPFGNVQCTLTAASNYYVYCIASAYTYREYDDFDADSCLVVKDPRLFTRKIMQSVGSALNGFNGFASHVKYIDPFNTHPNSVDVFFSKHFRYAYQNEYRLMWVPAEPVRDLAPIFIEIGSIEDIAELIRC